MPLEDPEGLGARSPTHRASVRSDGHACSCPPEAVRKGSSRGGQPPKELQEMESETGASIAVFS